MVCIPNEKPSPARSLSSGRALRGPGGAALSLGERADEAAYARQRAPMASLKPETPAQVVEAVAWAVAEAAPLEIMGRASKIGRAHV